MKTIRVTMAAALLSLTAGAVAAQERHPGADRVVKAMPTRYSPPTCSAKPSHFKVSSGATYLKTAIETEVPENQQRAIDNGLRVTTEAIQQNNQGKSAGAWYVLARLYLQRGDVRGADSALTRVAQLAADCRGAVDTLRQAAWVPLVNAGIEFTQAGNEDSAKVLFREANIIYQGKPQAFSALGVIYANAGQIDSAIVNLEQAARIAEQNNLVEERNKSTFNLGLMQSRAGKHKEAAATFEKYVAWVPDDIEGKRALAAAYRASGQTEKAQAVDQQIVAAGGAPSGGAGGGAGGPGGGVASGDVFNIGVTAFNEKRYEDAAKAFDQVTQREPWNRDAWYNLANASLAMKDSEGLVRASQRLLEIEPMNEDALKLYGQGLRETKKQDEQIKVVERLLALPASVEVTNFTRTPNGATLAGRATGREAVDAAGKPVKPAPMTLVFEFLDGSGNAVSTQEVAVPALPAGQTHDINVQAQGSGIVAWRYKRK